MSLIRNWRRLLKKEVSRVSQLQDSFLNSNKTMNCEPEEVFPRTKCEKHEERLLNFSTFITSTFQRQQRAEKDEKK